jgi:hypothetical protein
MRYRDITIAQLPKTAEMMRPIWWKAMDPYSGTLID